MILITLWEKEWTPRVSGIDAHMYGSQWKVGMSLRGAGVQQA